MMPFTLPCPQLRVSLGRADPAQCVGLPVLSGDAVEQIFPDAVPAGRAGSFEFARTEGWMLGLAMAPPDGDLEQATRRLYRELLQVTHRHQLARIWNYVPGINTPGPDGLENYRSFCRGRSLAFEQMLGGGFARHVPAASAVGTDGDQLALVFAASTHPVRHIENPRQVPAYEYPPAYGPRPPSFARASLVTGASRPTVFISGTSAITGHATIAPGETPPQLDCTLHNLKEIARACGLGAAMSAPGMQRRFKVYLRHAADLDLVAGVLAANLLLPDDEIMYLRADICRADLNVEIEVSLTWRAPRAVNSFRPLLP